MTAFNKQWLTLIFTSLVACIASLAAGCVFGPSTYSYDYLSATGTLYQADARTPVAGALIESYDWIVSFTDRSTVAVSFKPAVTTDAAGQFKFDSSKLSLHSGNEAESCTDVCVESETRYEDYCAEWTTETDDEFCVDWEIDSEGYEYCSDWEYSPGETYCSAWETSSYEACVAWGEDCDYYYPARDIGDITQAYSEITYSFGGFNGFAESSTTNYPGTSVVTNSTTDPNSGDTTVNTIWSEIDSFTLPLVVGAQSRKQALTANQIRITQERNAPRILARKITKPLPPGVTAPRARLTHKDALKLPLNKLSPGQKLKLEIARNGCGAMPNRKP